MAIVTPDSPDKLDDNQLDFASSLAEATFKQIGRDINFLIDSMPIGSIVAVAVNLPGMTAPNSSIWQKCDGSEITHPDSPLRSQGASIRFTPTLTDNRYLKGTDTGGQNTYGGNANPTTSGSGSANSGDLDENSGGSPINFDYAPPHDHTVSVDPIHYTVVFYLKIN